MVTPSFITKMACCRKKACGKTTNDMARAPIGRTLEESSSESTQAIGLKMKDTAEVPYSALMETDTMGSGYVGTLKAMDE